MRSIPFWLSLTVVFWISSAMGMDTQPQNQPLVGDELTLQSGADAALPENSDFALSEQTALPDSTEIAASVEPSPAALSLLADDPAATAPVAAATVSSGQFRVMTIGAPLLHSAPAPAPVVAVRRIGVERIYIVEGGSVRQYPASDLKRFSSIQHRDDSKPVQAPKSFVKLSDSVRASAPNIAFGTAGYVERNFRVMTVEPPVPEPTTASLVLIGSALAMLRRRRTHD